MATKQELKDFNSRLFRETKGTDIFDQYQAEWKTYMTAQCCSSDQAKSITMAKYLLILNDPDAIDRARGEMPDKKIKWKVLDKEQEAWEDVKWVMEMFGRAAAGELDTRKRNTAPNYYALGLWETCQDDPKAARDMYARMAPKPKESILDESDLETAGRKTIQDLEVRIERIGQLDGRDGRDIAQEEVVPAGEARTS